jgi:hypothetical protein
MLSGIAKNLDPTETINIISSIISGVKQKALFFIWLGLKGYLLILTNFNKSSDGFYS